MHHRYSYCRLSRITSTLNTPNTPSLTLVSTSTNPPSLPTDIYDLRCDEYDDQTKPDECK